MTTKINSDAGGLGDLARTDASGANLDVLRRTVHHRAHALEIGQPPSLGHVVSVRDVAPAHRALAADFTSLRHFRIPPRGPHMGLNFITQVALFFKYVRRSRTRFFVIGGADVPTQR